MKTKRDVPQSVFDSLEARKVQRDAIRESTRELNATPLHLLDPSNPNHPDYDLQLFGMHYKAFMQMQYK